MDSLMIAGGVGERIDAFLIDGEPLGDAEFLTDGLNGLLDARNDSHCSPLVRIDYGRRGCSRRT
jgi:hypothetical protein